MTHRLPVDYHAVVITIRERILRIVKKLIRTDLVAVDVDEY